MYYTAIIMGLAGSLHCAGMCSPLATAMTRNKPFLLSTVLYNTGRIFLYGLLGTIAAAFGSTLHLNIYQQIISVLLGGIFLFAGLSFKSIRIPLFDRAVASLASKVRNAFGIVSNQKPGYATFILGMLNGLLPCGLTYLALSACLILPSATDGLLFMFLFGLGTWPVMIGSVKLLSLFKNKFSLARFSKIAFVLVGCTLLLRVWALHPHGGNMLVKTPSDVNSCK